MHKLIGSLYGLFVIVLISLIYIFFLAPVRNNNEFSPEFNSVVKELVNEMLIARYRPYRNVSLEDIFTEELRENLDDWFPFFVSEQRLYFVNRSYMRSLRYVGDNQWYVVVGITEGIFGNSFFIEVGITQQEDGHYKISFVGKDA